MERKKEVLRGLKYVYGSRQKKTQKDIYKYSIKKKKNKEVNGSRSLKVKKCSRPDVGRM